MSAKILQFPARFVRDRSPTFNVSILTISGASAEIRVFMDAVSHGESFRSGFAEVWVGADYVVRHQIDQVIDGCPLLEIFGDCEDGKLLLDEIYEAVIDDLSVLISADEAQRLIDLDLGTIAPSGDKKV